MKEGTAQRDRGARRAVGLFSMDGSCSRQVGVEMAVSPESVRVLRLGQAALAATPHLDQLLEPGKANKMHFALWFLLN